MTHLPANGPSLLATATALAALGVALGLPGWLEPHPERVEVRTLPAFTGIEVWDLGGEVRLTVHAELPQRVTVATGSVHDVVTTHIRGDTLVVSGAAGSPVTVAVALPVLERLVLWGDTQATVRAVQGQDLVVTMADTAGLVAEGAVHRLELVVDAQSHAHLNALVAKEARVTASGASRVDLQVREELSATAAGGAGVFYLGDPRVQRVLHGAAMVSPQRTASP